jgi:hypothetical protein
MGTRAPAERRASRPRALRRLALSLALGLVLTACDQTAPSEGVPGEQGVALFDSPNALLFEHRLLVGSSFLVTVTARREADLETVSGAELTTSDESIFSVVAEPPGEDDPEGALKARVTMLSPGEASLQVRGGGELVDEKALKAALAESVEIYDTKLLSDEIDARLPEVFGLVDGRETFLSLGASDRCGAPLLAMNAATVTWMQDDSPLPAKPEEGTTSFALSPEVESLEAVSTTLTLTSPGFPERELDDGALQRDIIREIEIYPPSAVDEVDVAVASGDGTSYLLWGRAYVDDQEVIGLDFSWDASARVTLAVAEGPWTSVDVSHPAQGEPADTRPAEVTAEVFGVEKTIDVLAVSRAEPGRLPPVETESAGLSGCGNTDTCDPYAAFAPALLLLRLRRRKRAS